MDQAIDRLFSRGLRWCVCILFLLNCCGLLAQVNVTGTVVDPDGAAVPAVDVLLKTSLGGAVDGGSTIADPAGHFSFPRIATGDYQLEVPSKYGFERYLAPVRVQADRHELRIQLTPLVVAQDVTVT